MTPANSLGTSPCRTPTFYRLDESRVDEVLDHPRDWGHLRRRCLVFGSDMALLSAAQRLRPALRQRITSSEVPLWVDCWPTRPTADRQPILWPWFSETALR